MSDKDIIGKLNEFCSEADTEDSLTVELDMTSGKFFDERKDIRNEVMDWLRDSVGMQVMNHKYWKEALTKGERAFLIEHISTTGLACCYITFTKRSDVVLFKMAWAGQRGQ